LEEVQAVFEFHNFYLFLGATLLLNISPGPDMVYVVGRSIAEGRRAGMFSSFGVCTGALIHAIAAALGLSVILATSALAFTLVKWAGAAYLIFMGFRALLGKNRILSFDSHEAKRQSGWAIFRQGVLIDVLNPKVAIFFLAFLPQFVDPASDHRALQLVLLGLILVLISLVWEFILICCAAGISGVLRRNQWLAGWLNKGMGAVFIGLGLRLAAEKAQQ
jgi:threonine/homoserine/homoserine lactone efflux protein